MSGRLRRLVPEAVRRRYALKFMLVLLIIGLSVGALGYFGTGQLAAEVEQQAHLDQSESAEKEARNAGNWHDRNHFITEILSTSNVVVAGEVDDAYFSRTREQYAGTVNHLHYVDVREGQVVHTTSDAIATDFEAIDEPWTDQLAPLDERENMTHLEFGRTQAIGTYVSHDGTPVAAYAKPIPNERGQYRNSERFLVVTAELDALGAELIDDDGQLSYVVDPTEDRIVVDPSGASYFESYGHSDVIDGHSGSVEFGRPGETLRRSIESSNPGSDYAEGEYIASYARLPQDDADHLYVVVHTSTEEAFGVVHATREYGTLLSIVGIALVVLVGGLMGHNTSRSIKQLRAKTERIEDGDLDVEVESERIDDIGRLYDGVASMRDALREQIRTAERAREEAERERERIEVINEDLRRTARGHSQVMREAAAGDLTVRMDDSEHEAMAEIADEFNDMLGEIETTVGRLNRFAREVAVESEQVTGASEDVRSISERVAESIQEIAVGAERQNEALQTATAEMTELSTTTQEIAASSNEVADIAERTAETGSTGQEAAREAIDGMGRVETESERAVEEIGRLEDEVAQLDELTEQIGEIADQTTMLALNANIEASWADGDDPDEDGFGAVAEQVRDLSQETKAAAEEIETRLERIREQTERSATEVERTSDHIDAASESVRLAADALEEIAEYAQETNSGVQEISATTQQQSASTEEILATIDEAAAISQETTTEAENVAAAAEEQTTALSQVSSSASSLSKRAVGLSNALDRFEANADDTLAFPPLVGKDRSETVPDRVPAEDRSVGPADDEANE